MAKMPRAVVRKYLVIKAHVAMTMALWLLSDIIGIVSAGELRLRCGGAAWLPVAARALC